MENNTILELRNVHRFFGSLAAVNDLSFRVYDNEILGIAGPNGSGKTTLMNVVTQVIPPSKGEILFLGQPIHALKAHQICHLGISRTFQNPTVFETMTVLDNLKVGMSFGKNHKKAFDLDEARKLLSFIGLADKENIKAQHLMINDKKKLMIAVALSTKPKLLILDEPCAGLTTIESKDIIALIEKINRRQITVMLIEHNMQVLMNISQRVLVIDQGSKLCEGTPEEIWNNEQVIEKYLGRKEKKGVNFDAGNQ